MGNIRSCIRQEVHSSVEIVQVDIHEKLVLASVKEGQELNVSIVNYVSPESKSKPGQSRMNETYNSRYLLRALWKLDHLCPLRVNRSTNNFIISSVIYKSTCLENYIPMVMPPLNHTSLPSTAATFLATRLMAVLQPSRYSVFYNGDTPVSVSTLKPPLGAIGVLPLKPRASPILSVCI